MVSLSLKHEWDKQIKVMSRQLKNDNVQQMLKSYLGVNSPEMPAVFVKSINMR